MKVFVTGGTGFIGLPVIRKLIEDQHDILLLVRNKTTVLEQHSFVRNNLNKIKILEGSLENIEHYTQTINNFHPDCCLHMAWEGIPDYGYAMSKKNVSYSLKLYEFLAEINCKTILTTGSCWEYGPVKGLITEVQSIPCHNTFAAAKHMCHMFGKLLAEQKDINFIWVRLFYVYGPGQKKTSLLPSIISSIKNGKIPEIKTPFSENDFVYVDDVADAIVTLLKANVQGTYNVGSGKATSVKELIELTCTSLNKKCPIDFQKFEKPSVVNSFWADMNKMNTINWKAKTDIKKGINKTVQSYS